MLWNPYQYANKILQDPTTLYGILDKNAMESISIGKKILQDDTRFYGILDKNAIESKSLANKILQDPTRSYKILQDSTGYETKMLWNPYQ